MRLRRAGVFVLDFRISEVVVVEVTTASNVQSIIEKALDRKNQYFDLLRKQHDADGSLLIAPNLATRPDSANLPFSLSMISEMLGRATKVGVLPLSVFGALLVSATRTILVIPGLCLPGVGKKDAF
jgi:hypothetical protein